MEHFYRNTQIVEYARMVDFIKDKPSNNYTGKYDSYYMIRSRGSFLIQCHDFILVPYNWAGTGHVVYDGSVYYNKFNTSVLIRYSLQDRKILAEKRKYSKSSSVSTPR